MKHLHKVKRLKFLGKLCGAVIAGLVLIIPGLAAATDAFTPSEQVFKLKSQTPVNTQITGFASTYYSLSYSSKEGPKMQRVIIRTDKTTLPKQEGQIDLWVKDVHVGDLPLILDEDGAIVVNKDKPLPGNITIQGSKTEGYEIDFN